MNQSRHFWMNCNGYSLCIEISLVVICYKSMVRARVFSLHLSWWCSVGLSCSSSVNGNHAEWLNDFGDKVLRITSYSHLYGWSVFLSDESFQDGSWILEFGLNWYFKSSRCWSYLLKYTSFVSTVIIHIHMHARILRASLLRHHWDVFIHCLKMSIGTEW